jgi:hypothetical protein
MENEKSIWATGARRKLGIFLSVLLGVIVFLYFIHFISPLVVGLSMAVVVFVGLELGRRLNKKQSNNQATQDNSLLNNPK